MNVFTFNEKIYRELLDLPFSFCRFMKAGNLLVSGQNGRANNTGEPSGDGLWQEQSVSYGPHTRYVWFQ